MRAEDVFHELGRRQVIAHGASRGEIRTSAAKPRRGDTFGAVSREVRESRNESAAPSGLKTLLGGPDPRLTPWAIICRPPG